MFTRESRAARLACGLCRQCGEPADGTLCDQHQEVASRQALHRYHWHTRHAPKRKYACTACGEAGHNRRTCPEAVSL